jgi:hypothetical protein
MFFQSNNVADDAPMLVTAVAVEQFDVAAKLSAQVMAAEGVPLGFIKVTLRVPVVGAALSATYMLAIENPPLNVGDRTVAFASVTAVTTTPPLRKI